MSRFNFVKLPYLVLFKTYTQYQLILQMTSLKLFFGDDVLLPIICLSIVETLHEQGPCFMAII